MKTICRLVAVTLLGGAGLVANAQPAGDMPGYPYLTASSGGASQAERGAHDPRMLGDMGDHPHQQAGPGSNRPMSRDRQDPTMRGTMPDHPHLPSTTGSSGK